jgi:hypothetical protein
LHQIPLGADAATASAATLLCFHHQLSQKRHAGRKIGPMNLTVSPMSTSVKLIAQKLSTAVKLSA